MSGIHCYTYKAHHKILMELSISENLGSVSWDLLNIFAFVGPGT